MATELQYPTVATAPNWSGKDNALAAGDSSSATYNFFMGMGLELGDPIKLTYPAFTTLAGATILGITVEINRSGQWVAAPITDYEVRLLKAGSAVGSNYAAGTSWPTYNTFSTATYGGSSDLWGTTWAPSDFDSGFGVTITPQHDASGMAEIAYIDWVRFTVTYTTAASGQNGTTIAAGASAFWLLLCDASRVASDKIWTPDRQLWTPRPAFSLSGAAA